VRWLFAKVGENGEKELIQPVHALKEDEGGGLDGARHGREAVEV
jgi:hypothetical protein